MEKYKINRVLAISIIFIIIAILLIIGLAVAISKPSTSSSNFVANMSQVISKMLIESLMTL